MILIRLSFIHQLYIHTHVHEICKSFSNKVIVIVKRQRYLFVNKYWEIYLTIIHSI